MRKVNFYLTQALTGYEYFGQYRLWSRGKCCPNILFYCKRWESRKEVLGGGHRYITMPDKHNLLLCLRITKMEFGNEVCRGNYLI